MKNILMIGYYGFDNFGDELICEVIGQSILNELPEVSLGVLTNKDLPWATRAGLEQVNRKKPLSILKALWRADIIVTGGGSLLQDKTSSKSFLYYALLLLTGRLFGARLVNFLNGFGPIDRPMNRRIMKLLLGLTDRVYTRDEGSTDLLKALKADKKIFTGPDAAFLYEGEPADTKDKKIGLSLRPWTNQEALFEEMRLVVARLLERGYEVVLLPFHGEDDRAFMEPYVQLGARMALYENLLEEVASCSMIMGMRLHALIVGALHEVPFMSISYDPKVEAFTEMTHQLLGGQATELDHEALLVKFDQFIAHYGDYKEAIQDSRGQLQRKAGMALEDFSTYVRGGKK